MLRLPKIRAATWVAEYALSHLPGRPQKFGSPVKQPNGTFWQYWVQRKFTLLPRYVQGRLIVCGHYWETWPTRPDGTKVLLYVAEYPFDPRSTP